MSVTTPATPPAGSTDAGVVTPATPPAAGSTDTGAATPAATGGGTASTPPATTPAATPAADGTTGTDADAGAAAPEVYMPPSVEEAPGGIMIYRGSGAESPPPAP